ncbi:unnamed protein product, partial [Ambrosiozyma monospora]
MMSLVDYSKEIKSFQHDDSLSSIENLSKLSIFSNFQDVHSKIKMSSILTLMKQKPIEDEIAKMFGDINLHIKFPSHESYLMYARYLLLSLHVFIEYEYYINFEKTPTYLLHSVDLPEVPNMGAVSLSEKPQPKGYLSSVFAYPGSHSISPLGVTRLKFERVVKLTVVAIRNTFNHLEILLKSPQNKLNQVVFANTFNSQLYPMMSLFRHYHALKLEDELIKIKQSVNVHLEYIESMASMLQSFSDPPDSLDDDTPSDEEDEESDLQTLKFVEI